MPRKNQKATIERKVALCYVRLSYSRDGEDQNSPEHQRANILAKCQSRGWIPEWYEDVGGHNSGRTENREQWQALQSRLNDPDVVALVANDLSRLYRKTWRMSALAEKLENLGVALVLAAPGQDIDTSTYQGRVVLQFLAMADEMYAEDISRRTKDSIAFRKRQGKTMGRPPFGTLRDHEGFLIPSNEGAWLMPDGTYLAGAADECPQAGAIWRGYFEAARYALTLFAEGNNGYEKIAYRLNDEGWPFRDRKGNPRPIDREDVRRIVASWPEYGGIVVDQKAKDRRAYEIDAVDSIILNRERAVFPLDLLYTVAEVRQDRTRRPVDHGVNVGTRSYPLSGLTYCAHCDTLAREQNNAQLRTKLSGFGANGTPRYRHKPGVKCGCSNRSVLCETYEADFSRLIKLLIVRPEAEGLLNQLAIQASRSYGTSDEEFEKQKQETIAMLRRRIDAAIHLYGDGRIDREEYISRIERNERDIAHWEAYTTETEKLALELSMCINAVNRVAELWDDSTDEDRKGLVQSLFTEVVYNLDTQRIERFQLKPWADRFLILRHALYAIEDSGGEIKNPHTSDDTQEMCTELPHRGLEPLF